MCAQYEINLTKNEGAMTKSQSQQKTTKIMFFTPKKKVKLSIFSIQFEEGIR